jgi:hypothetical protein
LSAKFTNQINRLASRSPGSRVTLGAGPLPPPNRQEGKMNAHNDVKRPSEQSFDARLVLAATQLRFAARVGFLVARWLERCATNAEAAQRLFKTGSPHVSSEWA